jgi:hypothetical protein
MKTYKAEGMPAPVLPYRTLGPAKPHNIKVGDEVVVMILGYPVDHNGAKSPKHPCRGRVLKVGRIWIHVDSRGAPFKCRTDGGNRPQALPVEEAREVYRRKFLDDRRSDDVIEAIIASL